MSTPMAPATTTYPGDLEMTSLSQTGDFTQGRRRTQNRSIRTALMQWLVSHENNKNELRMLRHSQGSNAYGEEVAGPSSGEVHTVLADVLGAEEEATYYSNQYLRVLDFFGRRVNVSRNPDEPVDRFAERVLSMYRRERVQVRRWPYYLATLLLSLLLLASLAFMIAGIKILYDDDADDDGNSYDSRDTRGGILFSLAVLLGILTAWALSYMLSRYYSNPNQQIGGRCGRMGDHEPMVGSHY